MERQASASHKLPTTELLLSACKSCWPWNSSKKTILPSSHALPKTQDDKTPKPFLRAVPASPGGWSQHVKPAWFCSQSHSPQHTEIVTGSFIVCLILNKNKIWNKFEHKTQRWETQLPGQYIFLLTADHFLLFKDKQVWALTAQGKKVLKHCNNTATTWGESYKTLGKNKAALFHAAVPALLILGVLFPSGI